jgi:hypothetical protein
MKLLNLAALLLTLTVNALANILPINGRQTGDIANSFPIYFLPAGYVFSIWGLIYLFLFLFIVFQFLPAGGDNPRLARVGGWFILTNFANAGWLVLFHYGQYLLAELVILGLLATLIVLYQRLEIGLKPAASLAEKGMMLAPFQIYLAWVSVAVIANTSQLFNALGVAGRGAGAQFWFVVVTLVAVALALAMTLRRGDSIFSAVLAWALIGIALKQTDTPLVVLTASIGAALSLLFIGYLLFIRPRRVKQAI